MSIIFYLLEILKWIILARVLVSWLPMIGVYVDRSHPVLGILFRITDPILDPLARYTRFGNLDLSAIVAFFVISFLQNLIAGRPLAQTLAFAVALIIAFSVHEFAHAWVAFQLGDPTARNQGRLTLDPRKHLDILGTVMVLAVGFGWAKPVPVNAYNLRNGPKTGLAVVSLAGPLSNLVMAVLAAVPLRLGMVPALYHSTLIPNPQELVLTFVYLNVILMVFNLLPIAPLDGFSVLAGLLPYPASESFRKLAPAGPLILLLLIFLGGGILSTIMNAPTQFIVGLLV